MSVLNKMLAFLSGYKDRKPKSVGEVNPPMRRVFVDFPQFNDEYRVAKRAEIATFNAGEAARYEREMKRFGRVSSQPVAELAKSR